VTQQLTQRRIVVLNRHILKCNDIPYICELIFRLEFVLHVGFNCSFLYSSSYT